MQQQDRAMRRRQHQELRNIKITTSLLIITAVSALVWVLASIQPIPSAQCNVTTYSGTFGSYNQCEGK